MKRFDKLREKPYVLKFYASPGRENPDFKIMLRKGSGFSPKKLCGTQEKKYLFMLQSH